MRRLRDLSKRTPATRERHLDFLRAVAIGAVVLGHWLAIGVVDRDGQLAGDSALAILAWAHPLTWLFQVMPVFFFVGGFANAASLASYRRRSPDPGAASGWLLERSRRLVRPVTALLIMLGCSAVLARGVGADPSMVAAAVWLATLPLWFLVAYLGMVLLTPLTYAVHQRAAMVVPAAGDRCRTRRRRAFRHRHRVLAAYGNFLFGWLAIHQVDFLVRPAATHPHRRRARPACRRARGPDPADHRGAVPGQSRQRAGCARW